MTKQSYQTLERKARLFATRAHNGQHRLGKKHLPYITHCAAVVRILKTHYNVTDVDTICAAWLHDVIEDAGVTEATLIEKFNPHIASMVVTLTRNCTRDEYLDKIKAADKDIQMIKMVDVLHNLSTMEEEDFPEEMITKKIDDCNSTYFSIAKNLNRDMFIWMQMVVEYWRYVLNRMMP